MKIAIPTLNRVNNQITINQIPDHLKPLTYLCCPASERSELQKYGFPVMEIPESLPKGIGQTRQYILENCDSDYVWMIDDDLTFSKRNADGKLNKITPNQFLGLYDWVKASLRSGYPMVGISAQVGNNRYKNNTAEMQRIYSTYGLDVKFLAKNNIRFDEFPVVEDFHVGISVLRTGRKTLMNCEYAHADRRSNAPGGCSTYRNAEIQRKGCIKLAEQHYPYVKVVTKKSKSWKEMQIRYDVTIYWKKAYEDGLKNRKHRELQHQLSKNHEQ